MVFQKKPDFESFSRQVTAMPHFPQSARGKRSSRKKDIPMCAFDLLATVAGKLLAEGEDSPFLARVNNAASSSSPAKRSDEVRLFKNEVLDQDSCNESPRNGSCELGKEEEAGSPDSRMPPALDPALDKESAVSCGKRGLEFTPGKTLDWGSPDPVESAHCLVDEMKSALDMHSSMDLVDVDVKPPPALVSSDSSGEVPPIRRSSSFPRGRKACVERDEDGDSSACTHPSTGAGKGFKPAHYGDDRRRIKKLASKFRRGTPLRIYKRELSHSDAEMEPSLRSCKLGYSRQRTQKNAFKRRRLLDHCSVVTAEERSFRQDGVSSRVNRPSTSVACQKPSFEAKDCHVKMTIKSFKVPELVIEIPEDATVGSLKRAVTEAVNSIFGNNGLRVGVLLHGKKVRDDSRSLSQAGIASDDSKLEDLCFSLEPNCSRQERLPDPNPSHVHEHIGIAKPVSRIPPAGPVMKSEPPPDTPARRELDFSMVKYHGDSVHSPPAPSPDNAGQSSKAIVPISPVKSEVLAVAPLRKVKRSEQGQRRIRRPFSVSEVEALVQAVEKLGTGRWRDVKIQAFDAAKHRTYVDLKDKWKTLVHTASISPQQRRGEPVPQELLDRVLRAQAYWSQQQAKLQPRVAGEQVLLLGI